MQLLCVLPAGRIRRRLRARVRGTVPENRRDDCRRRRSAPVTGRTQSGSAADVVRRPVPRHQGPVSGLQASRAVTARSDSPFPSLAAARGRHHRSAESRRPRQHSRRRCRDPRRPGAPAAALLRQGDVRRVARRDAAGTSRRAPDHGDHDVRHRGDRRRTTRASAAAACAAG